MPRYVAFLRAINVGGHTVNMDELRRLFRELGFENVESFIASGNIIFDAAPRDARAIERAIEAKLREALGYEVATFVRTASALAQLCDAIPFTGTELENATLYVAFLPAPPSKEAVRKLMSFASAVDDFRVRGSEAWWLCRKKMSESAFSGTALEKALTVPATLRNISTIRRLAARYA